MWKYSVFLFLAIKFEKKENPNVRNESAFQSKTDHPRTEYTDTLCSCDLDLDPITLTTMT